MQEEDAWGGMASEPRQHPDQDRTPKREDYEIGVCARQSARSLPQRKGAAERTAGLPVVRAGHDEHAFEAEIAAHRAFGRGGSRFDTSDAVIGYQVDDLTRHRSSRISA